MLTLADMGLKLLSHYKAGCLQSSLKYSSLPVKGLLMLPTSGP